MQCLSKRLRKEQSSSDKAIQETSSMSSVSSVPVVDRSGAGDSKGTLKFLLFSKRLKDNYLPLNFGYIRRSF